MKLKEFVNNFNFEQPKWNQLPEGFPNCDLERLGSEEISRFNAIKTLWELSKPPKIKVRSREEGFARATTRQYLDFLGYSQGSLKEVKGDIQRARQDGFLKAVPGSTLSELGIDLGDWHEALKKSVISPKVLQSPLKSFKGSYRNLEEIRGKPFRFNYPPVDDLQAHDLTYEIFIELVNKTDWHLRRLVESLEKKLSQEQKSYQIEQSRIRDKLKST